MGRAGRRGRHHPKRMGEKFRQIRDALELSQNGMVKRLGSPEGILGTSISGYERGHTRAAFIDPPSLCPDSGRAGRDAY